MDIRIVALLDLIKRNEETSNAIVAGGAVRDYSFDMVPRDYDIFVPTKNKASLKKLGKLIQERTGVDLGVKDEDGNYDHIEEVKGVLNFSYEGIDVDIIGRKEKNDDDFANEVIESFNFGLNKAYFDGASIADEHEDFQKDKKQWSMSLLRLDDIGQLPKNVAKYQAFNDRLKQYTGSSVRFNAPCLTLNKLTRVKSESNYNRFPVDDAAQLVADLGAAARRRINQPPIRADIGDRWRRDDGREFVFNGDIWVQARQLNEGLPPQAFPPQPNPPPWGNGLQGARIEAIAPDVAPWDIANQEERRQALQRARQLEMQRMNEAMQRQEGLRANINLQRAVLNNDPVRLEDDF